MEKLPAQPLQGLIDGLAVLQRLASGSEPLSGSVLAEELGLEKTKANRILKTLAHLGFASRTHARQYLPGPAMHVLSAQSLHGSGLLRKALPVLDELTKMGLVVALGVLWRNCVCYLYHYSPGISRYDAIGSFGLYPAEGSSAGRAILAELPEEDVRAVYSNAAPQGFDGVEPLLAELRDISTKGFALVPWPDHASLAASLGAGTCAAIALSGKIPAGETDSHVRILKDAVAKINAAP